MADWQGLWDDTELLYNKFREAKDGEDNGEHNGRINRCLDLLNDVERDLEKAGAVPHSTHGEDEDGDDSARLTFEEQDGNPEPIVMSEYAAKKLAEKTATTEKGEGS
jgi:hypothetical protein